MRALILTLAVVGTSFFLALAGCSHKANATSELEKAAVVMEQPAPAPPPASRPVPAQPEQPPQPEPAPVVAPPPAQEMQQAVAAYKSGDLQDAVTRLQKLRATPVMSPQQRIALNDAMAAVMSEIYALAAKGDARAIQAVKQYEQMQTQPH
jgi:hypothetical protein